MGKRKTSSRGPQKKIKQVLPSTFTCLFCNHDDSVVCALDKKAGIGSLSCKICGQSFQAKVNALSAAVDIYSEWVDACEAVASKPEGSEEAKRDISDNEDDY